MCTVTSYHSQAVYFHLKIFFSFSTTNIKMICDESVDLDDSELKYMSGLNTDTYVSM